MDDEFRNTIRQFGLTEKETDTYLCLLENGPTTVTEVAAEANVSKRHVYNVAKRLEDHHFVIVNDYFTPTTIEAAPPDDVRDRLSERIDTLYRGIKARYQDGTDRTNEIRVLKSRSTVINEIEDLIESAERQIALSLPAVVVPTLQAALRDAVERDVLVLLLVYENQNRTGSDGDPLADVSLDGVADVVRYRSSKLPLLLSVDDEAAFVSSRGVLTQPKSPVSAIYLGQSYLESLVFGSLVTMYWANAEEVAVPAPHELPHTHTNIRRAAIDATLHRETGAELAAEVEARPPDHPDSVVNVVGDVTEVDQRLVDPTTELQPNQCTIYLQTDDGIVSIGGKGAMSENYRAYKTTLREA